MHGRGFGGLFDGGTQINVQDDSHKSSDRSGFGPAQIELPSHSPADSADRESTVPDLMAMAHNERVLQEVPLR